MAKPKNSSKRRSTSSQAEPKPVISPQMIAIIAAVALILTGGLLVLGNWDSLTDTTPTANNIEVDNLPFLGDANAPVTLVDFSDYGCSHCQHFEQTSFPILKEEYIDAGKVKYAVHPYYLGSLAPPQATEANWCALDQDKFFEYRHVLFENPNAIRSTAGLLNIAGQVEGLNVDALSSCISSNKYANLARDSRLAGVRQGVDSTPTFMINGRKAPANTIEGLRQIIDQELARSGL